MTVKSRVTVSFEVEYRATASFAGCEDFRLSESKGGGEE